MRNKNPMELPFQKTPQELLGEFGTRVEKHLHQLHYLNVVLTNFTSRKNETSLWIVFRNFTKIYAWREERPYFGWVGRPCRSGTSQKIGGKRWSHDYNWTGGTTEYLQSLENETFHDHNLIVKRMTDIFKTILFTWPRVVKCVQELLYSNILLTISTSRKTPSQLMELYFKTLKKSIREKKVFRLLDEGGRHVDP